MAKKGYKKLEMDGYSQVSDKINLQTNITSIATLYYLLDVVNKNTPLDVCVARDSVFPAARALVKSPGSNWNPNNPDEHTTATLKQWNLVDCSQVGDKTFIVPSEFGKEFLLTFELKKEPVANNQFRISIQDKVSLVEKSQFVFLMLSRVLVRQTKYHREIHPYQMLLRFLAEENSFITQREWAWFLNEAPCKKDSEYDLFKDSLDKFRKSNHTTIQLKKSQKLLTMLVAWDVLTERNERGKEPEYILDENFKKVVLSNLSQKETSMIWSDANLIKNLFIGWAQLQQSMRRDENITVAVAMHYARELESDLDDPIFTSIDVRNLFSIVDHSTYNDVKQKIVGKEGFDTYDASRGNGYFSRALNMYEKFLGDVLVQKQISRLVKDCIPYLSAIRTKPFILLAGISGTGKSRMVRQLARGCCPANSPLAKDKDGNAAKKPGNFEIIPVRPNWHDSTELMGYVTRITESGEPEYVVTPFISFLVKAWLHPEVPFFLCLDEMNLAPVEQYFAEYLSVIESRNWVNRDDHSKGMLTDVMVRLDVGQIDGDVQKFVDATVDRLLKDYKPLADSTVESSVSELEGAMKSDKGIRIPPNLVVMGTVNMDETTCSFSRKVLDRAMSFELNDVSDMYDPANIDGEGDYEFGSIDVNATKRELLTGKDAYVQNQETSAKVLKYIKSINDMLDSTPFKIAYRSRNEIMIYCLERTRGALVDLPHALDEVTSMKILSRIEGDENAMRLPRGFDANEDDAPDNLLKLLKRTILEQLGRLDGTVGEDASATKEDREKLAGKYTVCSSKLEEMDDRLKTGYTGFWR